MATGERMLSHAEQRAYPAGTGSVTNSRPTIADRRGDA
jgi:hypothetical protein